MLRHSMHHDRHDPFHGARAQAPLHITPQLVKAARYIVGEVDRNTGYQARNRYRAAQRWVDGTKKREYFWLGVSGASTPIGLGGLYADLIKRGLVDVIVVTGANAYHDLHMACALPVRQGSPHVNDNRLRAEGTTRIYDTVIGNTETLKAQDLINEDFGRKALKKLKPPFSTAQLLNALGKEMLNDKSGVVVDKAGSFIVTAAKYGVPVFLDSGANHSLGMDMSLLFLEGLPADTSPSLDVLQAAALSIHTQPQTNIFLGEGGPRNFIQTTAPTAAEIFGLEFEGSEGCCIRFTTADVRAGSLSGSTESEAVTWGKYRTADPEMDIEVWGEYSLSFPLVAGYVAGQAKRGPRRLMDRMDEIYKGFIRRVEESRPELLGEQSRLRDRLHSIRAREMEARRRARA